MKYYAIKRKKDGKLVSGTDFRYYPPRSIFADEFSPPLLIAEYNIESTLLHRKINQKYYDVVAVEVKEKQEDHHNVFSGILDRNGERIYEGDSET